MAVTMILTFGLTWVSWVEVLLVGTFIDPKPPPYLDFTVILRHLTFFFFMPGIRTHLFSTEFKWESLTYCLRTKLDLGSCYLYADWKDCAEK